MKTSTADSTQCSEIFSACVRALRLGEEGKYTTTFTKVIDCIQRWIADNPKGCTNELMTSIDESMNCQIKHNNIRLADILEYEIMPVMFQ